MILAVAQVSKRFSSRLKNKPADEMYLSFAELDLQKLKHVRKLVGCHFSTLLGVIQAEASKRFLNNRAHEVDSSNKVLIGYPIGRPAHPVVLGGPLQNHT